MVGPKFWRPYGDSELPALLVSELLACLTHRLAINILRLSFSQSTVIHLLVAESRARQSSLAVIDGTLLADHLAGSRAPFKSFFELDHFQLFECVTSVAPRYQGLGSENLAVASEK